MAEKRKFEARKVMHTKLKELWEERGMVKFEQQFHTISDSVVTNIKKKINKLEKEYTIAYEGCIPMSLRQNISHGKCEFHRWGQASAVELRQ